MAYRNSCSFIGNIGGDAQMKNFPDGGKLANSSIAVTKRWKTSEGEKKEKTIWVNLTFPEHLADNATSFIKKGRQVFVEGELETREYEKDGQKHTAFSVRVDNYQLLGSKPEEAEG